MTVGKTTATQCADREGWNYLSSSGRCRDYNQLPKLNKAKLVKDERAMWLINL